MIRRFFRNLKYLFSDRTILTTNEFISPPFSIGRSSGFNYEIWSDITRKFSKIDGVVFKPNSTSKVIDTAMFESVFGFDLKMGEAKRVRIIFESKYPNIVS